MGTACSRRALREPGGLGQWHRGKKRRKKKECGKKRAIEADCESDTKILLVDICCCCCYSGGGCQAISPSRSLTQPHAASHRGPPQVFQHAFSDSCRILHNSTVCLLSETESSPCILGNGSGEWGGALHNCEHLYLELLNTVVTVVRCRSFLVRTENSSKQAKMEQTLILSL